VARVVASFNRSEGAKSRDMRFRAGPHPSSALPASPQIPSHRAWRDMGRPSQEINGIRKSSLILRRSQHSPNHADSCADEHPWTHDT